MVGLCRLSATRKGKPREFRICETREPRLAERALEPNREAKRGERWKCIHQDSRAPLGSSR